MKENHVQTYRIAHVCGTAASIHWESVEKAWIVRRPWPEFDRGFPAFSQIILCRNTLVVKMTAEEPDPCAVFTADNSPVHQDSCLEFFVQPAADCKTYFNFELNPNGCMKAAMGSCRQGRTFLSPKDTENSSGSGPCMIPPTGVCALRSQWSCFLGAQPGIRR